MKNFSTRLKRRVNYHSINIESKKKKNHSMNRFVFRRFDWSLNESVSHAANEQWFPRNAFQWTRPWNEKKLMLSVDKAVFSTERSGPMLKMNEKMIDFSKLFHYEVMNYMISRRGAPSLREKTPLPRTSPNRLIYDEHFDKSLQTLINFIWCS